LFSAQRVARCVRQANRSADLVLIGFGIWANFEPALVLADLVKHLSVLAHRFNAPRVVWIGASARHRNDFEKQVRAHNSPNGPRPCVESARQSKDSCIRSSTLDKLFL